MRRPYSKPSFRSLFILLAAALIAAACSSSTSLSPSGQAIAGSEGVSRDFCGAIAELEATIASGGPASAAIIEAEAAREVIPDGAPPSIDEFLSIVIEWLRAEPGGSPDALAEVVERNSAFDAESARGYLTANCPTVAIDGASGLGLILGLGNGGTDGGSAAADGEFNDGQPDDGSAAPPTTEGAPTTTQSPTTTQAPATTTTEPPLDVVQVNELLQDGPETIYAGTGVGIERVFTINTAPGEVYADEAEPAPSHVLVVEVYLEALTKDTQSYDTADILLASPEGQSVAAAAWSDTSGSSRSGVRVAGRTFETVAMIFETRSRVTDLTGWNLVIDQDERVREIISFLNPTSSEYPISLEAGGSGSFTSTNTSPGCIDTWEIEVLRAGVTINGISDEEKRAGRDMRLVDIEILVTNATDLNLLSGTQKTLCEIGTGQYFSLSFRLSADGRPSGPEWDDGPSTIEAQTSESATLGFSIPAGATELVLFGTSADEVIASWTLDDLPAVPGE